MATFIGLFLLGAIGYLVIPFLWWIVPIAIASTLDEIATWWRRR
jgi:hypothetical protein